MIAGLGELGAGEEGGKAAGLARLQAIGLPVPPALVVPVSAGGVLEAEEAADVAARLGEPLAVRSSAVGEDAADRSAAGQFESKMGVRAAGLASAVRSVWCSAESDRARAYGGTGRGMAVIVQREVPAWRAGVVFSRNPLTGARECVIECVFGHGERLVSGITDPDRYTLNNYGNVLAEVAVKEEPFRLLRTLRDDEALLVAAMARQAEQGFGHPVDMEFCFEGRAFWAVQCRAITTLTRRDAR
jgi:phosphoenolpyruvate synthase/pyruvate phosphate dikinase